MHRIKGGGGGVCGRESERGRGREERERGKRVRGEREEAAWKELLVTPKPTPSSSPSQNSKP